MSRYLQGAPRQSAISNSVRNVPLRRPRPQDGPPVLSLRPSLDNRMLAVQRAPCLLELVDLATGNCFVASTHKVGPGSARATALKPGRPQGVGCKGSPVGGLRRLDELGACQGVAGRHASWEPERRLCRTRGRDAPARAPRPPQAAAAP
jgi:hypothetical protein